MSKPVICNKSGYFSEIAEKTSGLLLQIDYNPIVKLFSEEVYNRNDITGKE